MKATGSLPVRLGEKRPAARLVTLARRDGLLSYFQRCRAEVRAPQLGQGLGYRGGAVMIQSLI